MIRRESFNRFPHWFGELVFAAIVVILTFLPGPALPFPPRDVPNHHLAWPIPIVPIFAVFVMLVRHRWPVPSFVSALVLYLVATFAHMPSLGVGVALIIVAFTMADNLSTKLAWILGTLSTVIVALTSVIVAKNSAVDSQVFIFAIGIALGTALGDSNRSRREYAAAMKERAERAEQTREQEAARRVAEERLRIAQDLHDTVAHRISIISLNAGVASTALERKPEQSKEALVLIREASREVLNDIGVLLRYLRNTEGEASSRLPQPTIAKIPEVIEGYRKLGMTVDYETLGDLGACNETVGAVVFRFVQEGLTNAHKHGSDNYVHVKFEQRPQETTVDISNPISSARKNQPSAPSGKMGLLGLRERINAIGGEFQQSISEGTFSIRAIIPTGLEA